MPYGVTVVVDDDDDDGLEKGSKRSSQNVRRQQYAMILSTYESEARKVHNVAVSGVAQQLQDSRTGQISSRPYIIGHPKG